MKKQDKAKAESPVHRVKKVNAGRTPDAPPFFYYKHVKDYLRK